MAPGSRYDPVLSGSTLEPSFLGSGFGGIDSSGGTISAFSAFGGSPDSEHDSVKRSEDLNAAAAAASAAAVNFQVADDMMSCVSESDCDEFLSCAGEDVAEGDSQVAAIRVDAVGSATIRVDAAENGSSKVGVPGGMLP